MIFCQKLVAFVAKTKLNVEFYCFSCFSQNWMGWSSKNLKNDDIFVFKTGFSGSRDPEKNLSRLPFPEFLKSRENANTSWTTL